MSILGNEEICPKTDPIFILTSMTSLCVFVIDLRPKKRLCKKRWVLSIVFLFCFGTSEESLLTGNDCLVSSSPTQSNAGLYVKYTGDQDIFFM